jgi:hypothetical protein
MPGAYADAPRPWLTLDELERVPEQPFWAPYLYCGEHALVVGLTGNGKSTLWAFVAACHTNGWAFPGQQARPPGHVFLLGSEENYKRRLAGRLDAFKVFGKRFHCLEYLRGKDRRRLRLPEMEAEVVKMMEGHENPLLITDPLACVLTRGASRNDGDAMREAIMSIGRVVQQVNGTALTCVHPRKGNSGSVLERVAGSMEIVNAADQVNWVERISRKDWRHRLVSVKDRGAWDGPFQVFTTAKRGGVPVITKWEDKVAGQDQVGGGQENPTEQRTLEIVKGVVCEHLDKEPTHYKTLYDAVVDGNLGSKATLGRARDELNVETHNQWINGKSVSIWSKPEAGWPE